MAKDMNATDNHADGSPKFAGVTKGEFVQIGTVVPLSGDTAAVTQDRSFLNAFKQDIKKA